MKCVSIDLDGTLLNSKHEITDETELAIQKLKAKDFEVIINTGRAYNDVIKLPQVQRLECPIFCINGSNLFNSAGELVYEATLSFETYKRLLAILRTFEDVNILVYTNQGGLPSTLPPLFDKTEEELDEIFQGFDYDAILEIDHVRIYKMIALVDESKLDIIDQVKEALSDEKLITYASSHLNNVEITSIDAHKGKAIHRYEKLLGVEFEDIISFGDGGNDLAQFEVSTISVAMGNAPDSVKEKATLITKSNDENGVVYALEELLELI